MLHQQWDVFASLAQWGHLKREVFQAIKQIGTKLPLLHIGAKIAIVAGLCVPSS